MKNDYYSQLVKIANDKLNTNKDNMLKGYKHYFNNSNDRYNPLEYKITEATEENNKKYRYSIELKQDKEGTYFIGELDRDNPIYEDNKRIMYFTPIDYLPDAIFYLYNRDKETLLEFIKKYFSFNLELMIKANTSPHLPSFKPSKEELAGEKQLTEILNRYLEQIKDITEDNINLYLVFYEKIYPIIFPFTKSKNYEDLINDHIKNNLDSKFYNEDIARKRSIDIEKYIKEEKDIYRVLLSNNEVKELYDSLFFPNTLVDASIKSTYQETALAFINNLHIAPKYPTKVDKENLIAPYIKTKEERAGKINEIGEKIKSLEKEIKENKGNLEIKRAIKEDIKRLEGDRSELEKEIILKSENVIPPLYPEGEFLINDNPNAKSYYDSNNNKIVIMYFREGETNNNIFNIITDKNKLDRENAHYYKISIPLRYARVKELMIEAGIKENDSSINIANILKDLIRFLNEKRGLNEYVIIRPNDILEYFNKNEEDLLRQDKYILFKKFSVYMDILSNTTIEAGIYRVWKTKEEQKKLKRKNDTFILGKDFLIKYDKAIKGQDKYIYKIYFHKQITQANNSLGRPTFYPNINLISDTTTRNDKYFLLYNLGNKPETSISLDAFNRNDLNAKNPTTYKGKDAKRDIEAPLIKRIENQKDTFYIEGITNLETLRNHKTIKVKVKPELDIKIHPEKKENK